MEKALTKLGNSYALVLDKVLMELIGIGADSAVKLTVRGDELIVPAARGSDGTERNSFEFWMYQANLVAEGRNRRHRT